MITHPTPWQRKLLWTAVTALSLAVLAVLAVLLIRVIGRTVGFLQPLLLPVAIAGILAFLLEPVVQWLGARGVHRRRAVILVFALVTASTFALLGWLVPVLYGQSLRFGTKLPGYTMLARDRLLQLASEYGAKFSLPPWLLNTGKPPAPAAPGTDDTPVSSPEPASPAAATDAPEEASATTLPPPGTNPLVDQLSSWLNQQIPTVTAKVWAFIQRSVGGFLGVFGVGSSRVDLQACKLEYSIVSPK